MRAILKISRNVVLISGLAFSCAFGDPKIKKATSGKCTGSENCKACTNCSRCQHCNSGGTCSVCTPRNSSSESPPAAKENTPVKSKATLEKQMARPAIKKDNPKKK